MSWFARRTALDPGDPAAVQLDAYKEGRRDEQTEAGRREPRLTRRGSPLGALFRMLVLILATMAVITIVLVVQYGSFAAAGQAVDTALSSVIQHAPVPGH
jgi:hypothetical protein